LYTTGGHVVEGIRAVERHARNEEGQALVEYALVLTLVAVVALASLTLLGENVNTILDVVQAAIAAAIPGG
jgi:pilus assembly protein Flp/PilA